MGGACSSDSNSASPSPSATAQKYETGGGENSHDTTKLSKDNENTRNAQSALPNQRHRAQTRGQSIDFVSANETIAPDGTDPAHDPPPPTNTTEPLTTTDLSQPRKLDPTQLEAIKIATMKQSIFGECLTDEQLEYFASQCDMKKWSKIGDRICEQSEKADCMYIVHKGEVLLEVQDHQLDNRSNAIQVARMLAENSFVPIVDEHGTPIVRDPSTPLVGPIPSPNKTPLVRSLQHPSPNTPNGHSPIGGSRSVPATRAEQIAIEAAARIEQETLGTATPARDLHGDVTTTPVATSLQAGDKTRRNNNPNNKSSVSMPPATPNPPSTPSMTALNIHTQNGENDEPELSAIPSVYTASQHTMYMCVKSATQTFGVGLFFAHGRYMYSAINNSLSTHLIILPRTGFDSLWEKWPDTRGPMMKHLGEYLEDSLGKVSWLSNPTVVPPTKLTLLTSLFHQTTVPSGTMLFDEGDICNDDSPLYFILDGKVELTFTNEKGHKLTKVLSKGSIFGELGVLLGFSITAKCMTLDKCILRLCKRRWLNLFAMMCPRLIPTLRISISKDYHLRDSQILECVPIQAAFTDFCLKEFNAENIEFWSVAIRFRKIVFPHSSMEDVLQEAAMIYNRYISETSVLQVNIKQQVRSQIKSTLQSGEVTKDLFVAAEKEICQLMLSDTFTRFKATQLFTQAMNLLTAPLPTPILLNHTNIASPTITRTRDQSSIGEGVRRGLTIDIEAKDSAIPLMFGGKRHAVVSTPSVSAATTVTPTITLNNGPVPPSSGMRRQSITSTSNGSVTLSTDSYQRSTHLLQPSQSSAHLHLSPTTGLFRVKSNANEPDSPLNKNSGGTTGKQLATSFDDEDEKNHAPTKAT